MAEKKKKIENNKHKKEAVQTKTVHNPKGKNADKLKLKMSFNEAVVKAVNTKIKINKKHGK